MFFINVILSFCIALFSDFKFELSFYFHIYADIFFHNHNITYINIIFTWILFFYCLFPIIVLTFLFTVFLLSLPVASCWILHLKHLFYIFLSTCWWKHWVMDRRFVAPSASSCLYLCVAPQTAGGLQETYFKTLADLIRNYKRKNQGLAIHLHHSVKKKTPMLIQPPRRPETQPEAPATPPARRSAGGSAAASARGSAAASARGWGGASGGHSLQRGAAPLPEEENDYESMWNVLSWLPAAFFLLSVI